MSGISMKISIVDKELSATLERLYSHAGDLTPFHANVGEHFLNSIQDRFDTETAPDGSKWAPHAPATVQSRLRRNGNSPLTLLRETGELAGSFNYEATNDHVNIGTPVIYAAIQHGGGKTGRNHTTSIPSREFMGTSSEDELAISEMAETYLKF